ncbi:MAG: alpha-2-macroglobulin [Limisphaerales bacterium]
MKLRIILLTIMVSVCAHSAEPRDALWRQVRDAESKAQPRTALESLEPIVTSAIQDQAWAEAARAIGKRIALEIAIEGRQPEAAVSRLAVELGRAPAPLKPVFHTLLGNAYWSYFRQNRWRFTQRTATATAPGTDFTTWDLRRLFAEIDTQFQSALANDAVLKATPIADFDALLEKGTVPDSLRPTLYDFVAHEALDFYEAGEQGLARPEDAFVPSADSPILGSRDEFVRWQPTVSASETNAPAVRAIRLYQDLLRHHLASRDPGALILADIERLNWAHQAAAGPGKDIRHADALVALGDRWAEHELSAHARQTAARTFHRLGRFRDAHRLAKQALDAYPNSIWTRDSAELIAEIEASALSIGTERSWNNPWPTIDVDYRNLTKVWFRAIRVDWEQFLDRRFYRPERLNRAQRLEILARPTALEWSADLPATPDYRPRQQSLLAPTTLAPGFYFIFASQEPGFPEADNQLSVATVWVSELALVTGPTENGLEGFVLDANTGEPKSGATVEAWYLAPGGERRPLPPRTTDGSGFFRFPQPSVDRGHQVRATLGNQQIAITADIWWRDLKDDEAGERVGTLILTDRALYRPGQTIQYKGIAFRLDDAKVSYQLRSGREITVVFRDANRQEIARRKHRTSDLGSYSGSFTAPRDRLPGQMSIEVEGEEGEDAWFNVEEYKRPKFQVVLDPPKESPRLNEATTWRGRALAYTGAAVDHAKVTWRVERQTVLPVWWGLFRPGPGPGSGTDQAIAHGTLETAPDGSFEFSFRALADPSALEADEPTFHFQIHVDITDSAGETRTAEQSVRIGYSAIALGVEAAEWQVADQPIALRITSQTLQGDSLASSGTLKVHRLEQPTLVHRARMPSRFRRPGPMPGDPLQESPDIDLSNPDHWRLGLVVVTQPFQTPNHGAVTNEVRLPAGIYRAILEGQDRFGKKVTARHQIRVFDPASDRLDLKVPHLFEARSWELEPGQEFLGVWGTGYASGRAFVEIRHRGKSLERYWTAPGRTQQPIRVAVTEALRGGFHIEVLQVRENRVYRSARDVRVPWKQKELDLTWETFRSKLEPGGKETWTAVIKPARPGPPESEAALRSATELAATLYDASLDQFLPHAWPETFPFWPAFTDSAALGFFSNEDSRFDVFLTPPGSRRENVPIRFRAFPPDLRFDQQEFAMFRSRTGFGALAAPMAMTATAAPAGAEAMQMDALMDGGPTPLAKGASATDPRGDQGRPPGEPSNPAQVAVRRNLTETAFFFPHLTSDSNGVVRISFTAPEALTEWRFLGFAHDKDLRSGALTGRAVTAKDIMVQPNPPRFLREGDDLEFTVKVVNQSETPQSGTIRLNFTFAGNGQSADATLGNASPDRTFTIPAKQSRSLAWRIRVPDGCGFLSFRAVAVAGKHSDGEEGFLPVLTRRVFLTESLPLPIRGPGEKSFEFASLRNSADSTTLRHQSLSVQMASHPAWYAVMALPYLMEYPHECSEQVFHRLYANALARHVALSNPRIRQIFDQWRATPALDSPLEKNPDLLAVALAETPWVRDARSEGEARRNVGVLFDANRLESETARALRKLEELLLPEGAWPWFPGGPRNDHISLLVVSGFGRLRQLGVEVPMELPIRTLARLDTWMAERFKDLRERKLLDRRNLDSMMGLYLYGRSFFLQDRPIPPTLNEALQYWLRQAREHWLQLDRQTQGHLALALTRFGNDSLPDALGTARAIAESLKQHSLVSEELGRYWAQDAETWWWFQAPVETQALMIEVFQLVTQDSAAAEECRIWLLKQKQTQNWKSTKATADAVYAILLGGPSWLGDDSLVRVRLAQRDITPDPLAANPDPRSAVEPGTGFYQVRLAANEIDPALAAITVRKTDNGIAWGAVHWQYFEDLSNVRPYAGSPLTLRKRLFVRNQTARGPVLTEVSGPVRVGDELIVRIELRTDRDLEYVHLKDLRGSGTEPVNVLSQYKFQDGLGYYETTRDTASHFFIEYLRKGAYVFEVPLRVQHLGTYPAGVAEVQCLYAPEFGSHSESPILRVR